MGRKCPCPCVHIPHDGDDHIPLRRVIWGCETCVVHISWRILHSRRTMDAGWHQNVLENFYCLLPCMLCFCSAILPSRQSARHFFVWLGNRADVSSITEALVRPPVRRWTGRILHMRLSAILPSNREIHLGGLPLARYCGIPPSTTTINSRLSGNRGPLLLTPSFEQIGESARTLEILPGALNKHQLASNLGQNSY
jgi:hypothetical protein